MTFTSYDCGIQSYVIPVIQRPPSSIAAKNKENKTDINEKIT